MDLENKLSKKALLLTLLALFAAQTSQGQNVVRYDLYVKDTLVTFGGKEKRAIAVNGHIPMPTLKFTEGDTAEIMVHNLLRESTSLHWHGVQLPNKEDGVPFLTQLPINPNETFTYRFPVKQNGTYWYHSHSGFQEQIGIYGSLVLLKKPDDIHFRKGIDDLPSVSLTLSEWININPQEVQRMLATGNDWFGIKKNTVQSYAEAIKQGHFLTKIANEWKRMEAMDVSDVYYDQFLINGKAESQITEFNDGNPENRITEFKGGEKVRLRTSNAGGSSYFWVTYAGGKITVVGNDGNDVEPVDVDRLIIGVSETYDIVVTLPKGGISYELLITPEDRSGSASLFLGQGEKQYASKLPRLKYFEGMKMVNKMMKMNGDMHDMGMKMSLQKMDMNAVMYPEDSGQNSMQEMDHSQHNMKMNTVKYPEDSSRHSMQEMDHSQHNMKMNTVKYPDDSSRKSMQEMDHSQHNMKMNTVKYPEDSSRKSMQEMDHSQHNMKMNTVKYPEDSSRKSMQEMDHSQHNMKMNTVKYPEDPSQNSMHEMDHSQHNMKMNTVKYPEDSTRNSVEEMDHSQHNMETNAVAYPEDSTRNSMQEMDHSQHNTDSISQNNHAQHNMTSGNIVTLNYGMLKSPHKTTLNPNAHVKELRFELTGNMNRYVWSIDNKVLSETDKIPVEKGEVLRITLYNNSMMRHPMHLHGYDFRLLNDAGEYSPLKNVVDVMPMETNVIEFEANVEGDWFFHCHILYHMMSGMNRVFEVGDYENPLIPNKAKAYKHLQRESNMLHLMAQNDFATNGNDGEAMLQNTRWSLRTEWRLGYNDIHGYEVETHLGRYIGKMQWFMPFVGFDWRYRKMGIGEQEENLFGQVNKKNSRKAVSLGIMYTLPMLVNFQAEVYHDGIVRLSIMREDIPISKRLRAGFMVNTDMEYMGGLNYIIGKNIGLRMHYDSDMGFGAGLMLNY